MNSSTSLPLLASSPALGSAGWREQYEKFFINNYGQRRIALARGEGSRVWDLEGKEYLDFLTGISVNNLGHCHPKITEAIKLQAETLVHCTNLYYVPVQIELARLLVENSFADRIIFGNSGAEANEAAIKLARRHLKETLGSGHHEILAMSNSFHGRTLATLTATGQEKVKTNFDPLPEGFIHAPFNDLPAVEAALTEKTGAIMLELIQGEGGICIADEAFVTGLRKLCDERGLLLIIDEIQTGFGRTGKLFAYEHYGITPDIMTVGKSLGGGLAMGAMLCTEALAGAFPPGSHGSTMAGNPLTAAAGLAYVRELIEGDWSAKAEETGRYMLEAFGQATEDIAIVKDVRGRGMMIAVELSEGGPDVLLLCEQHGLLINCTAGNTLRFLPPLNASRDEVDQAVGIVTECIHTYLENKG